MKDLQTASPVLQAHALTVRYNGEPALDQVSLAVQSGELHALIGHNGAGKSTLAACLTGQREPDAGTVSTRGRVALVTQHPQVIPDKPVAMTVWLGREPRGIVGVSVRKAIAETHALAKTVGIDLARLGIDPAAKGRVLSPAQCQIVALLAALATDPAVLIADEATAGAGRDDRHRIADTLRTIAASGVGVVMITHYADEVARAATQLTVLRQARAHGPYPVAALAETTIRAAMAGDLTGLELGGHPWTSLETPRALDGSDGTARVVRHSQADGAAEVLDDPTAGIQANAASVPSALQDQPGQDQPSQDQVVQDQVVQAQPVQKHPGTAPQAGLAVWAPDHDRPEVPISHRPPLLHAPAGQVSVILGSARDGIGPLMAAITGTAPLPGWACYLDRERLTGQPLHRRRAMGLGWVPDNRTVNGPAPGLSLAENLAIAFPNQPNRPLRSASEPLPEAHSPEAQRSAQPNLWWHGWRRPLVTRQATSALTAQWRALNGIPSRRTISQLSGGQAQAVMVGRELATNPRALVLNNPQHGMDPGAMADLATMLRNHARQGHAVLVTTTDRTFAQMVGDQFWRASNGTISPIASLAKTPFQGQPTRVPTPVRRPPWTIPGPLIALVLGLVMMAGVVGLWGASPTQVVADLMLWSWATPAGQAALLAHLVPLLVIAAGVAIMFRAEVISIGAEGQLYLGALAAGIIAQQSGLPGPVVALVALLGGALAGALWAAPAAILKGWLGANEIVATLILNALGLLVCAWMVAGPFNAGHGALTTAAVNPAARLPDHLVGPVGLDVLIAIAILAFVAMVLAWSRWGLSTRYLGFGEARARVMGIKPKARQAQVLILGGALAGLAGALVVLGPAGGRFNMVFSPGYGFMAITVALVGAYRGWGMLLAGLGFATLMAGAGAIQLSAGIPLAITGVLQGVLVLAVTMRLTLPKGRQPHRTNPTDADSRRTAFTDPTDLTSTPPAMTVVNRDAHPLTGSSTNTSSPDTSSPNGPRGEGHP